MTKTRLEGPGSIIRFVQPEEPHAWIFEGPPRQRQWNEPSITHIAWQQQGIARERALADTYHISIIDKHHTPRGGRQKMSQRRDEDG